MRSLSEILVSAVCAAAEAALPHLPPQDHHRVPASPRLTQLVLQRREHLRSHGKTRQFKHTLKELRKQITAELKLCRRTNLERIASAMQTAADNGQLKFFWQLLDELQGPQKQKLRQHTLLKGSNGATIHDIKQQAQSFASHFQLVNNCAQQVQPEVLDSAPAAPTDLTFIFPDAEEILKALKSCKNNKAADAFGLKAELLKHSSDDVLEFLVEVILQILRGSEPLSATNISTTLPLFKKGDPALRTNYRDICIIRKVVATLLSRASPLKMKKAACWSCRVASDLAGVVGTSCSCCACFLMKPKLVKGLFMWYLLIFRKPSIV